MEVCPVCGADVETEEPAETDYLDDEWRPPHTKYQGETYRFCSDECKREFEAEPEQYA